MNINKFLSYTVHSVLTGIVFVSMCIPAYAFAASAKPTCSLTVTSLNKTNVIHTKETIVIAKGDEIDIVWNSKNAKEAVRGNGSVTPISGSTTISPQKNGTYSFIFSSGSSRVTCAVVVKVVTGTIATSTLTSLSSKPTFLGKADGVQTIRVEISQKGSDEIFYTSKNIKVKKGLWKTKVLKALPDGTYTIVLSGVTGASSTILTTHTLTIGKVKKSEEKKDTTVVIEPVPLLLGGIARSNASVALSYLQVINIGKESAPVNGFWITQNGSASTKSIVSLTAVDDTVNAETFTVHAQADKLLFVDNKAFIPTSITLASGEMRLFTLKAVLGDITSEDIGKQLKIDVTDVDTDAALRARFPVRGTTWTLAQ